MSERRQAAVIERVYIPDSESCKRALVLLLADSAKRAAPASRPDDVRESNGYIAKERLPHNEAEPTA